MGKAYTIYNRSGSGEDLHILIKRRPRPYRMGPIVLQKAGMKKTSFSGTTGGLL
jgi:hypothetical protein